MVKRVVRYVSDNTPTSGGRADFALIYVRWVSYLLYLGYSRSCPSVKESIKDYQWSNR